MLFKAESRSAKIMRRLWSSTKAGPRQATAPRSNRKLQTSSRSSVVAISSAVMSLSTSTPWMASTAPQSFFAAQIMMGSTVSALTVSTIFNVAAAVVGISGR